MGKTVRISVGLLVLVAILLVLPFFTGLVTEKKSQEVVGQILVTLKNHPNTEVKLISYDRGWFSSDASFAVTVKDVNINEKKYDTVEFVFHETIQHGPFIVAREPSGKFDFFIGEALVYTQLQKSTLPLAPLPVQIGRSLLNYGGGQVSWLHINQLALNMDDFNITISGLSDVAKTHANDNKINNNFALESVKVTHQKNQFAVSGIKVYTDLVKNEQGIWLGDKTVNLNSIDVSSDGQAYRLENFHNESKVFEKDGNISSRDNVFIRQLGKTDQMLGPQQLVLEVDNVNAEALGKLNDLFIQMTSAGKMSQPGQIATLLVELLNKGIEAKIQTLQLTTPWGKLLIASTFKIPAQPDNTHIDALLFNMDGNVNADISKELGTVAMTAFYNRMMQGSQIISENSVKQQADQHLQKLVTDGWLVPKGDQYHIALSFKKGQLLVNDKPIKPQDLMPQVDLSVNVGEVVTQPEQTDNSTMESIKPAEPNVLKQEDKVIDATGQATIKEIAPPARGDNVVAPVVPKTATELNAQAEQGKGHIAEIAVPKMREATEAAKASVQPNANPELPALQPTAPQVDPQTEAEIKHLNSADHPMPSLQEVKPALEEVMPANAPQTMQPHTVNE